MKAKLEKRKTGFCMRMKESWKEMKLWDAEELNKLDWVISALILIFLFFSQVLPAYFPEVSAHPSAFSSPLQSFL